MQFVKQHIEIASSFIPEEMLRLIEKAGRVSHKSEDSMCEGSNERFIKMLIKLGHESVLEHASITVAIITDRGVTHELVRHRIGSYTQESTRYCNYNSDKFGSQLSYVPTDNLKTDIDYIECLEVIENTYNKLIGKGYLPEEVRDILPNCLKTEIYVTYNLREWRHFFKERCNKNAHYKIREVACSILELFKQSIPYVFDDLAEDGSKC